MERKSLCCFRYKKQPIERPAKQKKHRELFGQMPVPWEQKRETPSFGGNAESPAFGRSRIEAPLFDNSEILRSLAEKHGFNINSASTEIMLAELESWSEVYRIDGSALDELLLIFSGYNNTNRR